MNDRPSVTEALRLFDEAVSALQNLHDWQGMNEVVLSFGPAPIGVMPVGAFETARAALSAAALSQPKPGEVGDIIDLIRRLELAAEHEAHEHSSALMSEAADALSASHAREEALQARVDRLTAERDEALDLARAGFHEKHAMLYSRLATVEKEAAGLREALEPFARADRALGDDPGPYRLMTDTGYREIDRDAFRRARASLPTGETEHRALSTTAPGDATDG